MTTFFTFDSLLSLDASLLSLLSLATSKTDWFGTNNGGILNVSETVADAFCTISSNVPVAAPVTAPVTALFALLYTLAIFCAMDS